MMIFQKLSNNKSRGLIISLGLFFGYILIQVLTVLVITTPFYVELTYVQARTVSAVLSVVFGMFVLHVLHLKLREGKNINHPIFLLFFTVALAILSNIASDPVDNFFMIIHKEALPNLDEYHHYSMPLDFLKLFNLLVLIPLGEELIFRQIIVSVLIRSGRSVLTSISLASIFFALAHFNSPNAMLSAFVFGLISGFIYLRWGLLYAVLFHTAANLSVVFLIAFPLQYWTTIVELNFGFFYWAIVLSSGVLLFFFCQRTHDDYSLKK